MLNITWHKQTNHLHHTNSITKGKNGNWNEWRNTCHVGTRSFIYTSRNTMTLSIVDGFHFQSCVIPVAVVGKWGCCVGWTDETTILFCLLMEMCMDVPQIEWMRRVMRWDEGTSAISNYCRWSVHSRNELYVLLSSTYCTACAITIPMVSVEIDSVSYFAISSLLSVTVVHEQLILLVA